MTTTIEERIQALDALLATKSQQVQQLDEQKNALITEAVKIQGKIELLKELKAESNSTENKN